MKNILVLIFTTLVCSGFARPGHPLEHQLVTVRVTSQTWNEYRPWQKKQPKTRSFVGTVISGNRILVIDDDLADATLIQVEKFDRPPRIPARIVHCDYQVGLAIITVDEPGFFDNLNPVDIAKNADGKAYYCASWKSGQLSLDACRWSRASVHNSATPYMNNVGIKFITDIKSGGWGEPVFDAEKLIGIAYSQSGDSVTVLPAELINRYLQATELDTYPGFAWLGIRYQTNKGLAQAAFAGQIGKPTGIRIRACFPMSSADERLLPNDLLLELDGHPIDSEGNYLHPRYGRINFNLITTDGHYAGDRIEAKVLRNKKEITVQILLKNSQPSDALIPSARPAEAPAYLIAGGLVFRELDAPYLKAWGDKWEEKISSFLRILFDLKNESPTPEQQRLIVLADVFPDEYNIGYHDMSQNIVKTVNGYPIDSIKKMEEAFQHPKEGFHVIEFMPSYDRSKVILDAEKFNEATQSIMEKYQIPSRIRISNF